VNEEKNVQGSHPVKSEIVNAIKGTGEVIGATVETVSGAVATTVSSAGKMGGAAIDAVTDVTRDTIKGAAEVGEDLGSAAKGAVQGSIQWRRISASKPPRRPRARCTRRGKLAPRPWKRSAMP